MTDNDDSIIAAPDLLHTKIDTAKLNRRSAGKRTGGRRWCKGV
jgi:hypothetical protein